MSLLKRAALKIQVLLLFLYAGNIQASWLNEGATAYDTVNKARHWQAFLAVAVLTAALLSLKHVKDITRPRLALAVAALIYCSIAISGGFFMAEYSPVISRLIKAVWNLILAGYEIVGSIL